jgi:hypothetical protein
VVGAGVQAPGAFDYSRQTPVLDQMGISEELVVPSFVVVAINVMDAHPSVRAAIVGDVTEIESVF